MVGLALAAAGATLTGCPATTNPQEPYTPPPDQEGGADAEADSGPATGSLVIAQTETIPLVEASGLAASAGRFFAIGDRTAEIVTFRLEGGALASVEVHDMSSAISLGTRGSQWEAIAVDATGQVGVLSEDGEVHLFDAALSRRIGSAPIDVAAVWKRLGATPDANSQGEGMVLLERGHLLVTNEKKPPALVELGPAGDAPVGFTRGANAPRFALPSAFVPLAHWTVEADAGLDDLAELTVDPDGALWVLSQQSKRAARLEDSLVPGSTTVRALARFDLPAALDKAEGLAFAGKDFVIACDLDPASKNLFRLVPGP